MANAGEPAYDFIVVRVDFRMLALVVVLATGCVADTEGLLPGLGPPSPPPPMEPPTQPNDPPKPEPGLPEGVAVIGFDGEVTVLSDHDLLVTSLSGRDARLQKVSPDLEARWRLDLFGIDSGVWQVFAVTGDADDFIVVAAFRDGLRVGDRVYESERAVWIARVTLDGEIVWDRVIDVYHHTIDRVFGRVLASGASTLMFHQAANWTGFEIRGDEEHSFAFDQTAMLACFILQFDPDGHARWARAFVGRGFSSHPTDCSVRVAPDGSGFVAAELQAGASLTLRDPEGATLASYDNPSDDASRTLFARFSATGDFEAARLDDWRPMDVWVPYEGGVAQSWVTVSPTGFAFDHALLDRDGHVRVVRGDGARDLHPLPDSGFVATPFGARYNPFIGALLFFDEALEPTGELRYADFEDATARVTLTPHPDGYVFVTAYGRDGSEVTLSPSADRPEGATARFDLAGLLMRVTLP